MSTYRHRNIIRPLEYDFENIPLCTEAQEVKPVEKKKCYEITGKLLMCIGIIDIVYNVYTYFRNVKPKEEFESIV
jgi:hypothetical protein